MRTGIYRYKRRLFDGSFDTLRISVEIMDEHATTYLVRFLETHADGRGHGSLSWVQKRSVNIFSGARSLQPNSKYEIRLPYKD